MWRFSHRVSVRTLPAGAYCTVAAVGLLATAVTMAQGDESLQVDVADCVKIESPAERFRCYESRVDSALREQSGPAEREGGEPAERDRSSDVRSAGGPASPPAGVPQSASASEPASSLDSAPTASAPVSERVPERDIAAGSRGAIPDDFASAGDDEANGEQPAEIFSTIVALRETIPNRYLITLENGQVWRQEVPKQYALRPGLNVRIYSSRFGYRLAGENLSGFIQVERAR